MLRPHSNCEKCRTLALRSGKIKNAPLKSKKQVSKPSFTVETLLQSLLPAPVLEQVHPEEPVALPKVEECENINGILKGIEEIECAVDSLDAELESIASSISSSCTTITTPSQSQSHSHSKSGRSNRSNNVAVFDLDAHAEKIELKFEEIKTNHALLSRAYVGLQKDAFIQSVQDLIALSSTLTRAIKDSNLEREKELKEGTDQVATLSVVTKCIMKQKSADPYDVDSEKQLLSVSSSLVKANLDLVSTFQSVILSR